MKVVVDRKTYAKNQLVITRGLASTYKTVFWGRIRGTETPPLGPHSVFHTIHDGWCRLGAVCHKLARYYTPCGQETRNHVLERFGAPDSTSKGGSTPQHSTEFRGPRRVTVHNIVSIVLSWPIPSHTTQNVKLPNFPQIERGAPQLIHDGVWGDQGLCQNSARPI